MNDNVFWKPEPRRPWGDWRTWGMFIPLIASMLGFAFSGLFAFAFSDLGVIAESTQSWLVIIGSALIVWGAEANTPFTVVEVYRKILRKEANGWDYSALIASLVGTTINLLVTFASRQARFGDSVWRQWAMSWGPLVSGVAVALDYYGGMIELGFLFGSFDLRIEQWRAEREQWRRENGQAVQGNGQAIESRLAALEARWAWPTASVQDFRTIRAGLNGNAAGLTRERLAMELAKDQLNLPSSSTVARWLAMEGD